MIRALLLVALVATVAAQTAVAPAAAKPANTTTMSPKPAAANATAAKPATAPAATAKSAALPVAAGAAGAGAVVAQNGAAPSDTAMPVSKCGASVTETPFTLASISGKGCENNDALLGKPYTCAPTMLANITDITGPAADCTYPGEVNLASGEATCVDATTGASVGLLGNGKVQPAADGVRSFNGTWLFAKPGPFEGKINADGSMTVMTELKDGTMCELTYTAGTSKKPIKLPADEAAMWVAQAELDNQQATDDAAAIANGTAPAPEAMKSSAAAAGVSAGFMLLLAAVAALI